MLHAAEVVSDKGLDFLKLHHLHVVRGTELEYRAKPFPLLGIGGNTDLVVDFLERLSPGHLHRTPLAMDQLIRHVGKSKAKLPSTASEAHNPQRVAGKKR